MITVEYCRENEPGAYASGAAIVYVLKGRS